MNIPINEVDALVNVDAKRYIVKQEIVDKYGIEVVKEILMNSDFILIPNPEADEFKIYESGFEAGYKKATYHCRGFQPPQED